MLGGMAGTVGNQDPEGIARALRGVVRGEVDFSAAARALMTMDASNYRRVPVGVVAPRDAEDVAAALAVCREHGVPVVARGAERRSRGRRPGRASSWTSRGT